VSKELFAAAAILLTVAMYVPYARSILEGRTKPHAFSWLIWSLGSFVVCSAQLAAHGGVGAWPTGASGVLTACIAILAYRKRADNSASRTDWAFLWISVAALPVWMLTSDPLVAVALLTGVELAGFGPTLRFAYGRPHAERAGFYALSTVRNGLAIAALEQYSLTTVLFPAAKGVVCALLVLLIAYRRRQLTPSGAAQSFER
jgi:hypothetical protein